MNRSRSPLAETASSNERFAVSYRSASRHAHEAEAGPDLNRRTWLRKRRALRRAIHIECHSHWLADYVRASSLMHEWPVAVVPNPIDAHRWQPIDQRLARQLLSLPQDCPLILFGALGGVSTHHKGFDLLLAALAQLRTKPNLQNLQLVVFGQLAPQALTPLGFPVRYFGQLHDELSLRALYSAADVMVVPSCQEAFGETATKAHACGTPVVAFNISGLADIVADRVTGALAKAFEPVSLPAALSWMLQSSERRQRLAVAARQRALSLWTPKRIAGAYANLYREVLARP